MSQVKNHAILMYDTPEKDPRIFYATKFFAPDPFIYIETQEKNTFISLTLN
jgi:hypothetical protein